MNSKRKRPDLFCVICGKTLRKCKCTREQLGLETRESRRLAIYDQLRQMHSILKDIDDQEDAFDQSALDTVHGVLYLAESVFADSDRHPSSFSLSELGSAADVKLTRAVSLSPKLSDSSAVKHEEDM